MVRVLLYIVPVIALLIAIFYVLSNDQNEAILAMDFNLFGYAFSVLQMFGFAIVLSAFAPTVYFSFAMLKMGYQHGKERREVRKKDTNVATLDEVRNLMMHGQHELALKKLEKSKADDAVLRGQLLLALERVQEAHTCWQQAFDKGSLVCGYMLAESLLAHDEDPTRVYMDLAAAAPKDATRAYRWLLPTLLQKDALVQAASIAKTAQEAGYQGPEEVMAAMQYAELRTVEKEDAKKAMDGYKSLVKKAPHFVEGHLRLAKQWEDEGQPGKASKALRHGLAQTGSPQLADALDALEREQGHPGKAVEIFSETVVKQPEFAGQFHLWKVCKYLREDLLEDADQSLRAAMASNAPQDTVSVLGAEIAERRDDYATAAECYRQALMASGLLKVVPGQPLREEPIVGRGVATV